MTAVQNMTQNNTKLSRNIQKKLFKIMKDYQHISITLICARKTGYKLHNLFGQQQIEIVFLSFPLLFSLGGERGLTGFLTYHMITAQFSSANALQGVGEGVHRVGH